MTYVYEIDMELKKNMDWNILQILNLLSLIELSYLNRMNHGFG